MNKEKIRRFNKIGISLVIPKINCREFTIKLEGKKEKVDLKKINIIRHL